MAGARAGPALKAWIVELAGADCDELEDRLNELEADGYEIVRLVHESPYGAGLDAVPEVYRIFARRRGLGEKHAR